MPTTTAINAIPSPTGAEAQDLVINVASQSAIIDTRLVPIYADASARTVANPSPVVGQVAYASAESLLTFRTQSAWTNAEAGFSIPKNTAESISNAGIQNDDELYFFAEANSAYAVEVVLGFTGGSDAGNAAGLTTAWSVPAGAIARITQFTIAPGESTNSAANLRSTGNLSTTAVSWGSSTAPTLYLARFVITTSSTAGNVNFQWYQDVANATPIVGLGGHGYLSYTKIS